MKYKIVKNNENIKGIVDRDDEVNGNGIDGLLIKLNNEEKTSLTECVVNKDIQTEEKMDYWKGREYIRTLY
ncbi:hypothetical protein MKZ08_05425 [Viridibacillus sp. FSL R5-0477]|uniref:Uncharacterized protein n=1 Tax=Viridibacillus arenosi FSL R5-213 TaxID=1227360 RepID=W4EQJ8_9BACL|nr:MULTISPECIES: hypothetical protein [Viridibacillus]ETT82504.1 hypothetical protein C176_15977 [Viridibacillus arenosi FSL R5-213]OMC85474.1 hypothetical protein BK130_01525 [Viridibacillus sp. FSL H8-0123]OMC87248.1 hypothetical protein BK128_07365 [Viridibacillus sp. FSL H7-0596]OMC92409.1 hypothetical protein BK137_05010 [Viridibacillus arenosi]